MSQKKTIPQPIDRNILYSIIRDGIRAPSGDNSQPWEFRVAQNRIQVFHIPEGNEGACCTVPYYYKASCIAHGALIENMRVSAARYGLTASTQYFPTDTNDNHIATLTLTEQAVLGDHRDRIDLWPYILLRHSNRRWYEKTPIADYKQEVLLASSENKDGIEFYCTDDREHVRTISRVTTKALMLVFKNRQLFNFFLYHIAFTKREARVERSIDVRALDLLPLSAYVLRILTFRPLFYVLYYSGMFRLYLFSEQLRFLNTAGYGAFVARDDSPKAHVHTGEVVEHAWLTATAYGISFHPCTALLYIYHNLSADQLLFSGRDKKLIASLYRDLQKVFGVTDGQILFLTRIGHAKPMEDRSGRLAPSVTGVSE